MAMDRIALASIASRQRRRPAVCSLVTLSMLLLLAWLSAPLSAQVQPRRIAVPRLAQYAEGDYLPEPPARLPGREIETRSPFAHSIEGDYGHSLPEVQPLPPELIWDEPQPQQSLLSQIPRMFVRSTGDLAYIPRAGDNGIGMTDAQGNQSIAMPWSTPENAWIVTPGSGVHFWDGPDAIDLPPRLFDTYVDLMWRYQINKKWSFDVAFTPGYFSDWEQSDDRAWRFQARGIVYWQATETIKLMGGAAYLDWVSVKLLPVAGLLWKPTDYFELELLAPKSRALLKVHEWCGRTGWVYTALEFGGGSWAIETTGGGSDKLEYRDYRALIGYEFRGLGRIRGTVETGYVFGRRVELSDANESLDVDDSLVLRAGFLY